MLCLPLADAASAKNTVVQDILPPVNFDAIGTLSAGQGGLSADMWGNITREEAQSLIDAAPAPLADAFWRKTVRRVLLSAATTPPLDDALNADRLLEMRLNKLFELGLWADVIALYKEIPPKARNVAIEKIAMMAALIEDEKNICVISDSAKGAEEWWAKAQNLCQLHQELKDQARLSLDLLREKNPEFKNTPFSVLMQAALGGDAPAKKFAASQLDIFEIILAGITKTPLAVDLPKMSLWQAVLAARQESLALPVRIQAAERAAFMGALPVAELLELYRAVAFNEAMLANLHSTLLEWRQAKAPLWKGRALLAQAIEKETDPLLKAPLIAELPDSVAAYYLDQIEPRSDLAPQAGEFGKIFLNQAEFDKAKVWFKIAKYDQANTHMLWPYYWLLDKNPDEAKEWMQAQAPHSAKPAFLLLLAETIEQKLPAVITASGGGAKVEKREDFSILARAALVQDGMKHQTAPALLRLSAAAAHNEPGLDLFAIKILRKLELANEGREAAARFLAARQF
ncbi:MAG: hypothetical protein AB7U41_01995 [Dongiaceae bacterium]